MTRQRHYKNFAGPGDVAFVTTTCLDFAHLFQREVMRERMSREICSACRDHGAELGAFVVMTHHIHLTLKLPPEKGIGWFMQRLKSASAHRLAPHLLEGEHAQLGMQSDLNKHVFWQRSFRSITIRNSVMYWQKARYIHLNPVRAGLVESAIDYRWSSAWMFEQGWWDELSGLQVPVDYWQVE